MHRLRYFSQSKIREIPWVVMFAILGLFTLFIGKNFFLMRPVADDYCFAASLNNGFLNAIDYWYHNVQFDFLVIISNLFFVGYPIKLLNPSLASFISFIMMVSLFVVFLHKIMFSSNSKNSLLNSFKFTILLFSSILSYYLFQGSLLSFVKSILPDSIDLDSNFFSRVVQHSVDVMNSWAFWGVVNSSYLIPFFLSFYMVHRAQTNLTTKGRWILASGILVGTGGYVIASTTLITICVLRILDKNKEKDSIGNSQFKNLRQVIGHVSGLAVAIALGVVLSYFSPGGDSRRVALTNLPPDAQGSFFNLPIDTLKILAEVLLNLGMVSALLFGVLIGNTFREHFLHKYLYIKRTAVVSGVYLIVCIILTSVSEIFSYRAYWHTFTAKHVFFVLLTSIGIMSIKLNQSNIKRCFVPLSITTVMVLFSMFGLGAQMEKRFEFWAQGIDYGALSSIGLQNEWINACVKTLRESNPDKYYLEIQP